MGPDSQKVQFCMLLCFLKEVQKTRRAINSVNQVCMMKLFYRSQEPSVLFLFPQVTQRGHEPWFTIQLADSAQHLVGAVLKYVQITKSKVYNFYVEKSKDLLLLHVYRCIHEVYLYIYTNRVYPFILKKI